MTNFVKPTESELEILQVLWQHGPSSVRFVNDLLSERREVGYTTTLKLMQIMHEKKLVDRDTDARSHIYRPIANEQLTQQNLLNGFVESAFRGSAAQLVMQALGNHSANEQELEQIKALIQQLENDQQL